MVIKINMLLYMSMYSLCCIFPVATLKDNISHTYIKNVNE